MQRWQRNLYITWLAQILSLSGFGFMLPFIPFFIQELGVTEPDAVRRWVGLTTSVAALGMGVAAPLWGFLADRFGRKLMILRSTAAGAVIIFLMSRSQSVEAVFVLRLCQGLFTGTITAAATLVAAGTPRNRLSYALGFLASSTFIGLSLGPFLGGLAAEYFGYRPAFMIGAAILTVDFFIVLLFIRDVRNVPDQPAGSSADPRRRKGVRSSPVRKVTLRLVIPLIVLFLLRFARGMPMSFIPLYVQDIRGAIAGSAAIVGVISSLVGIAAAVAGLTITRLGDRLDKMRLVAFFLMLGALIGVPMFFVRNLVAFTVFYVLSAFALGGVEPNVQSFISEQTEPSRRGFMFGIQTTVGSAGLFFAPLTGSLISIRLTLPHIFLGFSAALMAACLIVVAAIRRAHLPATEVERTH